MKVWGEGRSYTVEAQITEIIALSNLGLNLFPVTPELPETYITAILKNLLWILPCLLAPTHL